MTPKEVLLAAIKHGGELMLIPGELGQLKAGFLADIILVNGDPLKNLGVLQDSKKILMVMKDGVVTMPESLVTINRNTQSFLYL